MSEKREKMQIFRKIQNFIKDFFKSILENEGLKRYGTNTLWLFIEQFLRLVLSTW